MSASLTEPAFRPIADLRSTAIALAERGFRVFPLVSGGKTPAIENWRELASSDADRVDRYWTDPITDEEQNWNIGVATGAGLAVVDVDIKAGKDGDASLASLENKIGALPKTFTVRTPSGGYHLWFRTADGDLVPNSAGALGPGLDVRGDGGYVVGPCSITAAGSYEIVANKPRTEIPNAWRDRLVRPRRSAKKVDQVGDLDDEDAIRRATEWLRAAPPATEGAGGDAATFRVACQIGDFGISEATALDLLLEHWNERCWPPWEPDELARKVENAFAYRQRPLGASSAAEFDVVEGQDEGGSPIGEPNLEQKPKLYAPTPYVWVEPTTIPPRDWLYARHLIRGFPSSTTAPGGVGKSSLKIAESLAMATGRDLLNVGWSRAPLRVWYLNLEDPTAELQRRIQATAKLNGLQPDHFHGRLYVDSGRERELVIAETTRTGAAILRPVTDSLIAGILAHGIDVVIIDPFVSSHRVTENDNNAIDMVAKEWGRIADAGNCAVDLVHHTRKMSGFESETTVESARGAKALTDACRSNVVVNRMTEEEAKRAGVSPERRRLYFRTFDDKNNLAPPADRSEWFTLVSVDLGNGGPDAGDNIGVVAPWSWPEPTETVSEQDLEAIKVQIAAGNWRKDSQAVDWVGRAVASVLGLDAKNDRARLSVMIKTWIANGFLEEAAGLDEKRKPRTFIRVGDCPAPA